MFLRWACFAVMCFLSVRGGEIKFTGVITDREQASFVIIVDDSRTSGWLKLGQVFEGVKLLSYDPASEILAIERLGRREKIKLLGEKTLSIELPELRPSLKSAFIYVPGAGPIEVNSDPDKFEQLKSRLRRIAAVKPQPFLSVYFADTQDHRLANTVIRLIKDAGFRRFSLPNSAALVAQE